MDVDVIRRFDYPHYDPIYPHLSTFSFLDRRDRVMRAQPAPQPSQCDLVAPSVAQRWVAMHGPLARSWLNDLSELVASCVDRWGLRIEGPLPGGSVSVVVAANRDGESLVLKLGAPWSEWSRAEAAALAAWDGVSTPRLLGCSDSGREILLERIWRGDSGAGLTSTVVAALIARLSAPKKPPSSAIPPLKDAIGQRFQRAEENRHKLIDSRQLVRARDAGIRMAQDGLGRQGLVHGDLLTKNILRCAKRGFAAIDPNPALGDISYDAALWAMTHPRMSTARRRCDALSGELGLDPRRTWEWALILAAAEVCLAPRARAEAALDILSQAKPPWWH